MKGWWRPGVVVVLVLCVLVTVESFATPGDAPKVGSKFVKRARDKMRPPSKISSEEEGGPKPFSGGSPFPSSNNNMDKKPRDSNRARKKPARRHRFGRATTQGKMPNNNMDKKPRDSNGARKKPARMPLDLENAPLNMQMPNDAPKMPDLAAMRARKMPKMPPPKMPQGAPKMPKLSEMKLPKMPLPPQIPGTLNAKPLKKNDLRPEKIDLNGKKKSTFGKHRPIPDEKEMEEKFLARFDKMIQDSNLPPDQLMGVKEELRSHAKKRLEMSKKRRSLMEELEPGSKDLQDALAEVDRNLKELGLEHRKIFEAAGIKPAGRGSWGSNKKGPSRRPPEGREVAMDWKKHIARRIDMVRKRGEKLKETAIKAGFEEDELKAIIEEVDEFTEKEIVLVSEMPSPPSFKDPNPNPEDMKRVHEHKIQMKEFMDKKRQLEMKIRQNREEL